MSLKEAYSLAHSAQCRLNIEAGRPDRDLRFVVGHLMHYESLRLRIVEIEHDVSKSQRSGAVAFKGTGHVEHQLQKKPSTGQLGRRSPPPPPNNSIPGVDEDEEDELSGSDDLLDDDEEDGGLGLTRFPSGSARPPELVADEDDYDDDDEEPVSPEEPDQATMEECMKGDGKSNDLLTKYYNGMRKCPCHGKHESAPQFGRMWELPAGEGGKEGVTRAVVEEIAA